MKKVLLFLVTLALISCESKERKIENVIFQELCKNFPVSKSNPMGAINLKIDRQDVGGFIHCSYDLMRQDSRGFLYSTKGTAIVRLNPDGEYEVLRYDF